MLRPFVGDDPPNLNDKELTEALFVKRIIVLHIGSNPMDSMPADKNTVKKTGGVYWDWDTFLHHKHVVPREMLWKANIGKTWDAKAHQNNSLRRKHLIELELPGIITRFSIQASDSFEVQAESHSDMKPI